LAIRRYKAEAKETKQNMAGYKHIYFTRLAEFLGETAIKFKQAESLSSLMSNRRAITMLHNHNNKDTKSRANRQKSPMPR
jgi:phage head maturation protease